MVITSLPFDYARLLDTGDRVRRTKARTNDSRGRRTGPRGEA
jgi:hypothetical protein